MHIKPFLLLFIFCTFGLPAIAKEAPAPSPYEVTWTEPGKSADDSVPLGNGEIGLNAWINPKGELEFFISRTDSWDEWGRQVKVGALRISMDGAKEQKMTPFTQTLDTKKGLLTAQFGETGKSLQVRLWVDAHRPVVIAEIDSETPVSPQVFSNLWRLPGNLKLQVTGEVSPGALTLQGDYEITPDSILPASSLKAGQIGWLHHNGEKPAYAEAMRDQALEEFQKEHPLKDCVFGAIVSAQGAKAQDDRTLQLAPGKRHVIEIAVETKNPTTPDQWQASTQKALAEAQSVDVDTRRKNTEKYWQDLQAKSHILVTKATKVTEEKNDGKDNLFFHTNKLPLAIGQDSQGGSPFLGKISSVKMAQTQGKVLFEGKNISPQSLTGSGEWEFPEGGCFEVDFTLDPKHDGHRRLLDKITVGAQDGFLLDVTPAKELRFINSGATTILPGTLNADSPYKLSLSFSPSGKVKITCNDKVLYDASANDEGDAFLVSQAYALQRYVSACGGRGNMPITFNGSIFTVPMKDRPENGDYRRWGSGYWWQNTRLPYYSMLMAGDFDMALPLLKMYSDMLPLCEKRAKKYLNCDGAYFAECMYSWGAVFPRSYGAPYDKKEDKLQDSNYHKYEWDSGLEVSNLALDYYAFCQDDTFAKERAIPLADANIRFFNTYYKSDDKDGKLNMYPSQSLETWWDVKNSASEVAGLLAITRKLLALPHSLTTPEQRRYWQEFLAKIPPIPVDTTKDGERKLAPATEYKDKCNVEVGELYSVFPYRICSFDQKELLPEAKTALKYRLDRGAFGWRQEDLFMAYLGETQQAKGYLLTRIKDRHNAHSGDMPRLKFPGFWGPGYDWLPDQCHGGVIAATVQSLVMQTSGEKIFLFPAFPGEWNVDFKLHAPLKTVVEGTLENGKITKLKVTPESRRKDVIICKGKE